METTENIISNLGKVWNAFNNMEHELYADYVFDALELLKEQQPKNGKWVGINEYVYHLEQETGERYCVSAYYDGDLFCNQCWTAHRKTKYNFCPNCGADMRGEQE